MLTYQAAIFDFDGTLCSSEDAIAHALRATFRKMHNPITLTQDDIQTLLTKGPGIVETFLLLDPTLREHSSEQLQCYIDTYRNCYGQYAEQYNQLYPGTAAILQQLHQHGLPLFIVSNKSAESIQYTLNKFALNSYFSGVFGEINDIPPKPNPRHFAERVQPIIPHLKATDCLMIGDTLADIEFAQQAGMDVAWCRYGFGHHDSCQAANPTFEIASLDALLPILLSSQK